MSVNSVSTGLSPSYGLLTGTNSQTARYAAIGREWPEKPSAKADDAQVNGAEVNESTPDAAAAGDGTPDTAEFQSSLDQALREGGASARYSDPAASDPSTARSSAGLALYKRISQYGSDNGPRASALLKSWNSIIQSGANADIGDAAIAKAVLQSGTPHDSAGVLDLTA